MFRRPNLAAVFDGYGGVEQVHLEEVPRPVLGDGDVVVQVVSSGVSHMDAYVREGRFRDVLQVETPSRQGTSFAGIVRGVGRDVQGFKVGTEVLGHDPQHGAHARMIAVDAGAVVKKPARLPWEIAGAIYLPGLTAFTLVQTLKLTAQDTVLVSAAAGGVGHIECQLAQLAGARVIGIAGEENHDYLRSLGGHPVAYGPGAAERIRRAAAGRPITALLDNYGHYEELAAEVGVPPERIVSSDRRKATEVAYYRAGGDRQTALQLLDIAELVAEWNIRVLVSGFYPLELLTDALADLDARHSRGVVVIGMDATAPHKEYLGGKLRAHHESKAVAPAS